MRKLTALFLCLILTVSLAAPALAADDAAEVIPMETETPVETEAPAETETPVETEAPAETEAPVANTAAEETNTADTLQVEATAKPREDYVDDGSGTDTGETKPDGTDTGTGTDGTDGGPGSEKTDDNIPSDSDDTDTGDDGTGTPAPTSGDLTDTITWKLEDGTLTITGTGAMPDYNAIGETPWFSFMEEITAIVIGEGVTRVGTSCFAHLQSVTSVTLPAGLESIGDSAFRGLEKLTAIDFPASLKTIEKFAFSSNALTAITLPEGLETLGGSAFSPSNSITEITLPGSLTSIGDGAFAVCEKLKTITVGEGITHLNTCFINCYAAETLNLPSTIQTLDKNFIAGLGTDAALKTITVADKADGTAFILWKDEDGKVLTNEQLVSGASFTGTLTAVWTNGVGGKLTDTILWELSDEGVLTISGTGAMPDDEHPWWEYQEEITSIKITEGITAIGKNSFSGCTEAVSAAIPSTVTSIGKDAFWECVKLESVNLPKNLETLGETAFRDCWALTEITIPGNVKTIGTSTFLNCEGLKTITVEEGVTALPAHFACDCTALETLSLPSTIQTLGMDSLPGNLKTITVAETGGRTFLGWEDVDGNVHSNTDLLTIGGHDTLTALWYGFTDVQEGYWFYDSVMYCYEKGLMNGTGDDLFEPYGGATRAQVVMVLYRLAGEPEVTASSPFTDVPDNYWFSDAVLWAAEKGITNGYGDGTFCPYNPVTREEFLVFLYRYFNMVDPLYNTWSELYDLAEAGVSDSGDISSWALEAETWSYMVGLQTGYANGDDTYSLSPRGTVTRAELATFLARLHINSNLYSNADVCLYLAVVNYPAPDLIELFNGEPAEKKTSDDFPNMELWCYYDNGVGLLIDFSTDDDGVVVDWTYVI